MQTPESSYGGSTDVPWQMWLSLAVRLFLGGFFLIAGAEKLTDLTTFAHAIAKYELLPDALVNMVALGFVWTEITVGVLLIAGAGVRGSALLTGAMLVVFLVAILSAMARGLEIDCGCFAPPEPGTDANPALDTVGWPKVFEDVGLLALAVYLVYFPKSYLTVDRLVRRDPDR
jgi:uncharacterized membrane protein YphA (DoxX/SURF4 family)